MPCRSLSIVAAWRSAPDFTCRNGAADRLKAGRSSANYLSPNGSVVASKNHKDSMKRRRSKIRIAPHKKSGLCLFLLIAVLALPLSMAQACQSSTPSETACCRAMRFACHTSTTPNACCLRNSTVPAPGVMNLPAERAAVHAPLFAVAYLVIPAATHLLVPSARHSQTLFGGDSPPGNVHIFLLHSALLI